mgnify:CR=1 FL=1
MRAGVASQPMATQELPAAWEDRILGYEPNVDPTQLLAHELNARRPAPCKPKRSEGRSQTVSAPSYLQASNAWVTLWAAGCSKRPRA